MNRSSLALTLVALGATLQLAPAGFQIEGSADGVPLGHPQLPNPVPRAEPRILEETPIGQDLQDKMWDAMGKKFRPVIKCELGDAEWDALDQAGKDAEIEAENEASVDKQFGPNTWDNASEPEREFWRQEVENKPRLKATLIRRAKKRLGCQEWDLLNAGQQEDLIREKIAIELGGQAAYDALDPAGKAAARDSAVDDKILALRCNIKNAIEFIKCIPAFGAGKPTGEDVATCLLRTWVKGRLCVDFISKGAYGSIKPNCEGKVAGCDPDNNPINIALSTFPCRKADKIYDPELYTLITTLYHEGIHALQVFPAKADELPALPTPEEEEDFLEAILSRLNAASQNECEAHGAENTLIGALCPEVQNVIKGLPADDGGNDFLEKVLDCLDDIVDDDDREAAAKAYKASLNDNKEVNDSNIACYNELKTLFARNDLDVFEKFDEAKKISWIAARLNGRLAIASSDSGVIQQTDLDPVTGDPFPVNLTTPLDAIHGMVVGEGDTLLVFGDEDVSGDGVVLAYWDNNGDGFLDQGTELELLRDSQVFGPVAVVPDLDGTFLVVHLLTGEIFSFFRVGDPISHDVLPNALAGVGQMEVNLPGGFVQRVILNETGDLLTGFPGFPADIHNFGFPGMPLATSAFDIGFGSFLPQPPVRLFDGAPFPPVILAADGLPVIDTTSVINQFTQILDLGGPPNLQLELEILPPGQVVGPIILGPDGKGNAILPLPPEPGMEIILRVPNLAVPSAPPVFENSYFVRDATPILTIDGFTPPNLFDFTLLGIPGMPHQLLFSPDPLGGFTPLPIPPIPGPELELQLQGVVLDPFSPNGFFKAQTATIEVPGG